MDKCFLKKECWTGWALIINLLMIYSIALATKFFFEYLDYQYYANVFKGLPELLIKFRFAFSISLRLLIVVSGVGVLLRRNFARLLAIIYSLFTIGTVYWKHPYHTFENVFMWQAANGTLPQTVADNLHYYVLGLMLYYYIKDILLALVVIYILKRKDIVLQFRKGLL